MSVPVDAIGSVLNQADSTSTSKNTINQNEFIKLFLAQLQFQDPLEPVDNREFLAQLAQFSNLQQSSQISKNTEGLLVMNSSAQALALLGKTVDVESSDGTTTGKVIQIKFTNAGPELSIHPAVGSDLIGIKLSQISQVVP